MKTITYAYYKTGPDKGVVISCVGSEMAHPVIDFDAIGRGGYGFAPGDFSGPVRCHLEKFPVSSCVSFWGGMSLIWTKKIPLRVKNRHRKFWGMKPLKRNR